MSLMSLKMTQPRYLILAIALIFAFQTAVDAAPPGTPTITLVADASSAKSGPSLGGTAVTVTGTNFNSSTTVTFGTTAGLNVSFVNATTLTATTPAHAPGAVSVTVANSGQSASLANGWTYLASPAPTITSVTPASGPTGGGTNVTLAGTGFGNPPTVMFGSTAATSVVFVSATQITAVSPAGSAGATDVTVTNPDTQSGVSAKAFTYTAVVPGSFRFLTSLMPDASTDTFYDVQLQIANAGGNVKFAVTAGSLPPGMSLDPGTGFVSGRPTVVNGSGFPVTFSATDGITTIFLSTSIKVSATGGGGNGGVTFTTTSLPNGTVGTAYSATVTVTSGVGPFIFGADNLPPGMSMNGTSGVISGTPQSAGTYFVLLTVTDSGDGNKASLQLPLIVLNSGSSFQFSTLVLPGATAGIPYSATLTTANAPGAVTFSAQGLPAGLSIDPTTGVISGTPAATNAGTSLVTISATSNGSTINFNSTLVVVGSSNNSFYWNFSGLPAAIVNVQYGRNPPILLDTRNPGPGPVAGLSYSAAGLPGGINYNASTGELSGVPLEAGLFPVTFTATDSGSNQQITLNLTFVVLPPTGGDTNSLPINLWVLKQTLKKGKKAGTDSWQGQYIYNANRTPAYLFDTTKDTLRIGLGSIQSINVAPNTFTGKLPKFSFKHSVKGTTSNANIILSLDESAEVISFSERNVTIADTLPGVLSNSVTLGKKGFKLDEYFDAKGTFTSTSGYRKTAFVVVTSKLTAKAANKDSALYTMLLADPGLTKFPPDTGTKTVKIRILNGATAIINKDMTALVSSSAGVSKSGAPTVKFKSLKDAAKTNTLLKFSYDSGTGKIMLGLKNLTLMGALPSTSATGIHTGVELTIGDKIYYTGITIFAPKAGSYSNKLP